MAGAESSDEIREITECFPIKIDDQPLQEWSMDDLAPFDRVQRPDRMRHTAWVNSDLVDKLWQQKSRMDEVFDAEQGKLYSRAREEIFPQDRHGSEKFRNRAGDKLQEVCEAVGGILDCRPEGAEPVGDPGEGPDTKRRKLESGQGAPTTTTTTTTASSGDDQADAAAAADVYFADICGGPGSWSEFLFELAKEFQLRMKGWGMTLKDASSERQCDWYPHLLDDPRWTALWGEDSTGNVYPPANLTHAVQQIFKGIYGKTDARFDEGVHLAVADGGFKIGKDAETGEHLENYQELFSSRIVLAEILMSFMVLRPDGHLVCKLFDSFSDMTASVIYACCHCFREVYLVKPRRSRIVNSERYLVAKFFKGRHGPQFDLLMQSMSTLHRRWHDGSIPDDSSPLSAVPLSVLTGSTAFVKSLRSANDYLANKQGLALNLVMNRVQEMRERGEGQRGRGGRGRGGWRGGRDRGGDRGRGDWGRGRGGGGGGWQDDRRYNNGWRGGEPHRGMGMGMDRGRGRQY
ncbi:unnamed protein product [Vitrella brassicaformis CCMP3155]|uniref:Cap-specific mRNA (nucleoside-2'-O-)-methyltransferase 1 n=2 Tax=Vitrella brassicaformis TaxID=1169539 RepID=A0A0G4GVR4_VITBC|nr:unnamed protein product [Vitrella brassicaformis CCMP3155]|eukprot:CEM35049.1 unnamed protein product [Vitrella brassicaformis CCMP3155]